MSNVVKARYLYDASGRKLGVRDNGRTNGYDYIGSLVYKLANGQRSLESASFGAGRILASQGTGGAVYTPYYYLTDHLGSPRVIYNMNTAEVVERNDYYPFGAKWENPSSPVSDNRYLYNGKEKQTTGDLSYLDYGARMYNPILGRWLTGDPLAEKFSFASPYAYCFGNPIRLVDPNGQEPTLAEAARMSAHVYGNKKDDILTGGWQVSSRDFRLTSNDLNNTATGLKSLVYERVVNGKVTEYTYATAGTEASWKDVGADLKQPLGLSNQYAKAADNAKTISGGLGSTELTYVGHSLGGGEAALNALITDRKAITFNAAGVSDITKALEGNWKTPLKSENKIDAYIMLTDPLNALQNSSLSIPNVNGNRHYLTPTDGSSIYNGHSIDNVLKSLKIKNLDEYNKL